MNPITFAALAAEPLRLWSDFMWKSGETMLASAQVIGYRINPVFWIGNGSGARNRREFALMGTEKFAAATGSLHAAASSWVRLTQEFGTSLSGQALQGWSAMASLATSRTSAQAGSRQVRFGKGALKHSVARASRLSSIAAQAAQRTLEPVRSRALANARRLAKR